MKVVVAVATQPGDSAAADLNASLLCLARNVAEWLGGELHVLHVWYAYGESMLLHSHFASLSPEEVAVYVERTRLQHADEINALLGRCQADVPSNRVHLVKGDPQDAIAEFCRSEGVDLLVMGTVARKGLAAALIGNTAERIASDLPSSVFVVKPAWLAAQSDRAGVHESRQEDVDPVPHSGHGFGSAARSAVGS